MVEESSQLVNGKQKTHVALRRFLRSYPGWIAMTLIVIAGINLGLSWQILWAYQREQRVLKQIQAIGGHARIEYLGPDWIPAKYHRKYPIFDRVTAVSFFRSPVSTHLLGRLKSLPCLFYLDLREVAIEVAGVEQLQEFTALQILDLGATTLRDAELKHLCRLTSLENLSLSATEISDEGLPHLRKLTSLRYLKLNHTRVRG